MKKVAKRKKSPSREKYERRNPTVSARLSKETHDKLRVNLAKSGMSLADGLRFLAGELELKMKPIDEARRAGYEEAKNRYMVTFPCSVCGEVISVEDKDTKQAIATYMREHGWGCADCID